MAEPHHSPSRAPYLESWGKTPGRQEAKPKSDTPPSSSLRRLAKRLVAAMAAPLAAFIGLYATGLLNEAFACITDRACRVRGLTRSPDPGPELRISRLRSTTTAIADKPAEYVRPVRVDNSMHTKWLPGVLR